jgi:hypothetical protein
MTDSDTSRTGYNGVAGLMAAADAGFVVRRFGAMTPRNLLYPLPPVRALRA